MRKLGLALAALLDSGSQSAGRSLQLSDLLASGILTQRSQTVEVDVTWTLQGPQHVHKTLSVTCGTATTTTTKHTTTTMLGVSGATTTPTSVARPTTAPTRGSSAVLGASVSASPARASTRGSSLPFTGSATFPLLMTALVALGAGTGLLVTQRRRAEHP